MISRDYFANRLDILIAQYKPDNYRYRNPNANADWNDIITQLSHPFQNFTFCFHKIPRRMIQPNTSA